MEWFALLVLAAGGGPGPATIVNTSVQATIVDNGDVKGDATATRRTSDHRNSARGATAPLSARTRKNSRSRSRVRKNAKAVEELSIDERSITELRTDLKRWMRSEAHASQSKRGSKEHLAAIDTLLRLRRELATHSTFLDGFAIKESHSLVTSRLMKIVRAIRTQARREQRLENRRPRTIPAAVETPPTLAQQFGGNRGNGGALPGGNAGGAAGVGGQASAGTLPDYGPELADLIERVIARDFWESAGGPGTIVYFQPVHVLVVTATEEVHEQVADLLVQLREAP